TDLCKPAVSPVVCYFFFSSRRRHTRFSRDWSSDVCSSDLLDGQLVQALPASREALAKFQRILRQRNRLLDRIGQGEGSAGSLEVWDAAFVEEASRVIHRRALAVEALSPLAAEAHQRVAGSKELSLRYRPYFLEETEDEAPTSLD